MSFSCRWVMLVVLASAAGCEKKTELPAPPPRPLSVDAVTGGPGQAEVRLGGDPADVQPGLAFTITRVYPSQQPTKTAPFHEDGGTWVYFDAALVSDPKVTFTVGTQNQKGDQVVAFGKAVIISPSREAGRGLVAAFAREFKVTPPAEAAPGALEPLQLGTAVLGTGIGREPSGGFTGRGTWVATKWFPSLDGVEGEVFFNYDLIGKRGEFAQKDADYDADVLAVLAAALRDGAPPPRTPENDPTLAASGPTFVDLRALGSSAMQVQHVGSTALLLTERRKAGDALLSVDLASGKATELAHVERSLDGVVCPDWNTSRCLLRETLPEEPGVFSSADPSLYWILESGKLIAVDVAGSGRHDLARAPLSPDGRYVALHTWADRSSGRGAFAFIEIVDRKTGKTQQVRAGEESFDVVGWPSGRAVAEVERGFSFDPPGQRGTLELELATGKLTPVKRALRAAEEEDEPTPRSPDGKRTFRLEGKTLVVTDVGSKRRRSLELHPADQKWAKASAFSWVSPRFLSFRAKRLTLVDTDAMKLSFPLAADDRSHVMFSEDFKWVLLTGEGGELRLGRVALPGAKPQ